MSLSLHHLGLTVTDLDVSVAFFEVLGFKAVGGKPDYPAVFVKNEHTFITLWRAKAPETATSFCRHSNVGLHHFALGVPAGELDALYEKVRGVPSCEIEFAPEAAGASGERHMMLGIPGSGARLELREAAA